MLNVLFFFTLVFSQVGHRSSVKKEQVKLSKSSKTQEKSSADTKKKLRYVPRFFDVLAKGSCFFLGIVKCLEFVFDAKTAKIKFHSAEKLRLLAVAEFEGSVGKLFDEMDGDIDERQRDSLRSMIVSRLMQSDDNSDLPIATRECFEARLQVVHQPDCFADNTWVCYVNLQNEINANIVIIVLPDAWTTYREPEPQPHGYVVHQVNPSIPSTLFLVKAGTHFMPVIFLATDAQNNREPLCVACVPTSDIQTWFGYFLDFWGFPGNWFQNPWVSR